MGDTLLGWNAGLILENEYLNHPFATSTLFPNTGTTTLHPAYSLQHSIFLGVRGLFSRSGFV